VSRTLTLRKKQSRPATYAGATKDWAAPKVETARDWAAPKVETARDWAAPKVEPVADKVKSDVLPAVAGAVTAALAATEPVRSEAATRGSAALAALKGEVAPPKPKKHRLRKLFLLATVLGGAYAGWKAWVAKKDTSDPVSPWATPSTPVATTGTVRPVSTPVRPATDDPGGAGPDEALADAADEAKAEDESPAESTTTETVTTETVTPKNARKASNAAAKGPSTSKS
jgi:hypothetical protein